MPGIDWSRRLEPKSPDLTAPTCMDIQSMHAYTSGSPTEKRFVDSVRSMHALRSMAYGGPADARWVKCTVGESPQPIEVQ